MATINATRTDWLIKAIDLAPGDWVVVRQAQDLSLEKMEAALKAQQIWLTPAGNCAFRLSQHGSVLQLQRR